MQIIIVILWCFEKDEPYRSQINMNTVIYTYAGGRTKI